MTNELKLLKKENTLRASCLSSQSQDALQKWREYAKLSDINPYDFELCYKELIGNADGHGRYFTKLPEKIFERLFSV